MILYQACIRFLGSVNYQVRRFLNYQPLIWLELPDLIFNYRCFKFCFYSCFKGPFFLSPLQKLALVSQNFKYGPERESWLSYNILVCSSPVGLETNVTVFIFHCIKKWHILTFTKHLITQNSNHNYISINKANEPHLKAFFTEVSFSPWEKTD